LAYKDRISGVKFEFEVGSTNKVLQIQDHRMIVNEPLFAVHGAGVKHNVAYYSGKRKTMPFKEFWEYWRDLRKEKPVNGR
jgi:hypothetical protein